jgi:hypothetical protein
MVNNPIMMHGRREFGYHASMPNTRGAERYISPMAHVPMMAMLRDPAKGACEV